MKLILLFTLLFIQPVWIMLGTLENQSYQALYVTNKHVGKTKRTWLGGEHKGWYLIQDWEISCNDNTVKNTKIQLYNHEDTLLDSKYMEDAPTLKAIKGSLADYALDIWCDR